MKKTFLGAVMVFFVIGLATAVAAQDSPGPNEGKAKVEGKAGDGGFDVQIQGERGSEGMRGRQGEQGRTGPEGPQGAPGPSGGGTVLGMDSTVALFVGLILFAVVIVAIVAASRGGHREV